jgi:hypothetical protein
LAVRCGGNFLVASTPAEIRNEDAESLRLPENWHTLVRSAVLRVIDIVRTAMLTGRDTLITNGNGKDARTHQLECEVARSSTNYFVR